MQSDIICPVMFGILPIVATKGPLSWIDSAIQGENNNREPKWSQSVAVGGEAYIKKIKEALGFRVRGRKIRQVGDAFELRKTQTPYGSADFFEADNTLLWDR